MGTTEPFQDCGLLLPHAQSSAGQITWAKAQMTWELRGLMSFHGRGLCGVVDQCHPCSCAAEHRPEDGASSRTGPRVGLMRLTWFPLARAIRRLPNAPGRADGHCR